MDTRFAALHMSASGSAPRRRESSVEEETTIPPCLTAYLRNSPKPHSFPHGPADKEARTDVFCAERAHGEGQAELTHQRPSLRAFGCASWRGWSAGWPERGARAEGELSATTFYDVQQWDRAAPAVNGGPFAPSISICNGTS
jgi:hypothetical protein